MSFGEDAEGKRQRNDPHAKPPEPIKHLFKYLRKNSNLDLSSTSSDFVSDVFLKDAQGLVSALEVTELVPNNYEQVLMAFCGSNALEPLQNVTSVQEKSATAFGVSDLPGIYPPSPSIHLV
jgi:hypothetical protein